MIAVAAPVVFTAVVQLICEAVASREVITMARVRKYFMSGISACQFTFFLCSERGRLRWVRQKAFPIKKAGLEQPGLDNFCIPVSEGGHIDHETVPHIALQHSFVCFVDVFDVDHFHIGYDVMLGAVIKHFLRFGNPADH